MVVYTPDRIKKEGGVIEKCLSAFNISSKLVKTQKDPMYVDYVLKLNSVIDLWRAKNLRDELALALASVEGFAGTKILDVKRKLLRVSLPHKDELIIPLSKFLKSKKHKKSKKILFPIGIDYKDRIVAKSIEDLPNLLIAGFDRVGGEVFLPCFLLSVVKKFKPSEVKFMLFDFSPSPLSTFEKSSHLYQPITFKPKKAVKDLAQIIKEIEKRKKKSTKKPEIIIAISCFQNLILKFRQVEDQIIKIAKNGPEVGVHIYIYQDFIVKKVFSRKMLRAFPNKVAFSLIGDKEFRYFLGEKGVHPVCGDGSLLFKYRGKKAEKLQGFTLVDDHLSIRFYGEM